MTWTFEHGLDRVEIVDGPGGLGRAGPELYVQSFALVLPRARSGRPSVVHAGHAGGDLHRSLGRIPVGAARPVPESYGRLRFEASPREPFVVAHVASVWANLGFDAPTARHVYGALRDTLRAELDARPLAELVALGEKASAQRLEAGVVARAFADTVPRVLARLEWGERLRDQRLATVVRVTMGASLEAASGRSDWTVERSGSLGGAPVRLRLSGHREVEGPALESSPPWAGRSVASRAPPFSSGWPA